MDKNIIACIPFGTPGYVPGKYHKMIPCDECGNTTWIGPKQAEKKQEENLDALCANCIAKKHNADELLGNVKHLGDV